MSETLEGTVGIWGIVSQESALGMLIESIDETVRDEKSALRNHRGCRAGRAQYDESVGVTVAAEILADDDFDRPLGTDLSLLNAIPVVNLNAVSPGSLKLIDEIKRGRSREDWQKVTVDAELLPFFPEQEGQLAVRGQSLIVGGDALAVGV